jgi:hypothetical protein
MLDKVPLEGLSQLYFFTDIQQVPLIIDWHTHAYRSLDFGTEYGKVLHGLGRAKRT